MIRKARMNDAREITAIYNHYIKETTITFETSPISVDEMRKRISEIGGTYPFLVYENENYKIEGFCYASSWKKKHAYHNTVESTVYMDISAQGKGGGTELMQALIEELKNKGIHAVIACITLPNPKSVKLHEKLGFKQASTFKEVGRKFGWWLDVGDWQLLL